MLFRRLGASAFTLLMVVAWSSPTHAAIRDSVREAQWHLTYLKVSQAHQISKGNGVIVGIVDTGVYPHVDLKSNLLDGSDVSAGGDGKGKVDQDGHGTRMASLVAAHGRPGGKGILGIAPAAKILPVKTAGAENAGTLEIASGIEQAVNNGADVINVSAATGPSIELEDAIARAASTDTVVIAGSGNTTRMFKFGYPAASPGVLAVGAIDQKGQHAKISITGPKLELCAPGVHIESAQLGNKYAFSDGTSASTAIVSGAAALVRAKFPDFTAPQVIQRLTATADDIGPPGRDDECGFGVLNILKALTADVPVTGGSSAPPSGPASSQAEPSNVASPGSDSGGINLLAVAGGIVGLVLVGGLVGVLALRRRQRS